MLGLAQKDGWLYVTQRPDVSRIKDTDGDGKADTFEVVTDGWEITGDYHEYAFGSRFDKDGNIWITLCLTGSFNANTQVPRVGREGDAGRQVRPDHAAGCARPAASGSMPRGTCSTRTTRARGTGRAGSSA